MKTEKLFEIIGSEFYSGVPDSRLKALCNFLMDKYGIDKNHHIIAANEGNCLALAAGYHLATGKVPVVYMQNSGEGNIINPLASLVNDKVYAIPVVFIIGWRGEPGIHDEPQHIYQGIVTEKLMQDMDVKTFVIGKDTTDEEVNKAMETFRKELAKGKQAAFIIREGGLSFDGKVKYDNNYSLNREEVIKHIAAVTGSDPVISTTGKISRELFEYRTEKGMDHGTDFLTVGSMGHCSSIALGVALNKPGVRVWCIDGDGAALMHMGAMAVIGTNAPSNLIHIVINNGAHETVGGMPTVAGSVDLVSIAKACGYKRAVSVSDMDSLDSELKSAKDAGELSFIEVKCQVGARPDLGRPTTTALENKENFMRHLEQFT
ncbi:MAG: phosphonopyruvate decarboxylase [Lachnospiraceae bacterium]|nr:phosphonopyruvate decarboxylase [Lachnospiraceae bacterium]